MKFHAFHFNWLLWREREVCLILGAAGGRVSYAPEAKWLYSVRLFLVVFKVEILWQTGVKKEKQ